MKRVVFLFTNLHEMSPSMPPDPVTNHLATVHSSYVAVHGPNTRFQQNGGFCQEEIKNTSGVDMKAFTAEQLGIFNAVQSEAERAITTAVRRNDRSSLLCLRNAFNAVRNGKLRPPARTYPGPGNPPPPPLPEAEMIGMHVNMGPLSRIKRKIQYHKPTDALKTEAIVKLAAMQKDVDAGKKIDLGIFIRLKYVVALWESPHCDTLPKGVRVTKQVIGWASDQIISDGLEKWSQKPQRALKININQYVGQNAQVESTVALYNESLVNNKPISMPGAVSHIDDDVNT